ncbi:hypothetical protein AGDE_01980 [Angomonas deanei]|uniref:Tetratricopeptide repeat, putative n=1 Tax=Angomonas deanei TaxID=59799 RepID=A0A7G2C457_9TRYP|nr:hypothetical protein AGDE_01980 [Angomonas deanei]CAD2214305.1 Tetratricopeptide repeat, putative [Angomonas deanei]|eukprot:EPY41943.1 hypothetical protein AGDE_01980 [Angomonas deanei]
MQSNKSLTVVQNVRAQELYYEGVTRLQDGDIEGAILSLLECSFFAPDNANPEAAAAECYVYLCDLQSAVRHYRRALWMLTRRKREAVRAAERKRGASLLLFSGIPNAPHFLSDDDIPEETAEGEAAAIRIPAATEPSSPDLGFMNDSGVQKDAVITRLVGLLDALSLVLFRLRDFEQALRCTLETKELLSDAGRAVPPEVELHRATYLMALQKDEEAEYLLESIYQTPPFAHFDNEIGALLIQLYSNRQAFVKARELLTALERPDDHAYAQKIRFEPNLTVAKHIFFKQYNYYREKALEQRDLGTISKCIMVSPNDLELVFARAKIYIDSGNEKKSVKDLFQCIKDSNGSHKEAIELMTSVLFSIGSDMEGQTGIEDAIGYFSESLKWRSDNIPVLLARGDCYVKIEDFEAALTDFQRVLELEPMNPEATRRISFLHDLWGCRMMAAGDMQGAEDEFTSAIKANEHEPLFSITVPRRGSPSTSLASPCAMCSPVSS